MKICLESPTNTHHMLNPSSASFQQVADTPHQSRGHKQHNWTASQRHYVTTLEYWFVMMNVNRDNNAVGCQQAQMKQLYKYPAAVAGFYYLWARRQTVYLPISPQWNGLMPPVVQLYTRADLGLRRAGEDGHYDANKNTCWSTFPGRIKSV